MQSIRRLKLAALALALCLVLAAVTPAAWSQEKQPPRQEKAAEPYHGNVKTKKFHRPGCRYYDCQNCLAKFKTREEAIKAGYIPCKVCKP